jgi:hypothetical protein
MKGPSGFKQKWHTAINTIVKRRKKGEQATCFCTEAAGVICTQPVALLTLSNAVNCKDLLYISAFDSKHVIISLATGQLQPSQLHSCVCEQD